MRCKECGYPISADQSRMLIFDCPLCGTRHVRQTVGESQEILTLTEKIRDELLCGEIQEASVMCARAAALFPFSLRVKFYQHAVEYAKDGGKGLLSFLKAAHQDMDRQWRWDIFRVTLRLMNTAERVMDTEALEQFILAHCPGISGRLYLAAVKRVQAAYRPATSVPLVLTCPINRRLIFTIPAEETDVILGRSNKQYFAHLDFFKKIGRNQCRLFFHQGAWYIEEMGSQNGTAWNQIPLAPQKPQKLSDGDSICLAASLTLTVHYQS